MSAFVQETQWCGFLSLFHYSSEIKACRRPVFNSLVYPHGRCLTWSSSSCRFVTVSSKKRPSDCTVDMQQMLSTGCRHLWVWRSRVCVSRIRTLKCLQNFYFLSSRCPAPAMAQQGRPLISQHPYPVWPWVPSPGPVLASAHPHGRAWYLVLLQCPQLPCLWLDSWIQFQSPWLQHPGSHPALRSLKTFHRFCFQN